MIGNQFSIHKDTTYNTHKTLIHNILHTHLPDTTPRSPALLKTTKTPTHE